MRLLLSFFLVLCVADAPGSEKRIHAFVSIPPLAYFVEQVAGPLIDVEVLIPAGQSPTTYEITPQQMIRLAEADLLFTVGVPFEQRLLKKLSDSFDNLIVVETQAGIELRAMSHSGHAEHDHVGLLDPHVWLDPKLAKIQVENICAALCTELPSHADILKHNRQVFFHKLDSVDTAIHNLLAPHKGKTIYVFHPAYGYFADAYGLHQAAIEVDGKTPSAQQLTKIIDKAREDRVHTLFMQPQFSSKHARAMAMELGGELVRLDPLARDYLDNLMDMASKVSESLSKSQRLTSPDDSTEAE